MNVKMCRFAHVTPHVKPRKTRQAVTGSAYVEICDSGKDGERWGSCKMRLMRLCANIR